MALEKVISESESPSEEDVRYLQSKYIQELEVLSMPVTMAERYFLIVTKGDELLDYRQAVKWYRGSEQLVLEAGDHRIADFDAYIDDVFEFVGLG